MKEQQPTNIYNIDHNDRIGSTSQKCEKCKEVTSHEIYQIRENETVTGIKKVCIECRGHDRDEFHAIDD